jgi:eukaryotic-like serine/threonine-protein kinase
MIPARWDEIKEKLQLALDMEPAERLAYLHALDATDPALRKEVESLLESHQQAGDSFLNAPALASVEPDPELHRSAMIGRRIGSWQIVAWIGAGGMGEVYRAVRADEQYQKQVALKQLRLGPDPSFVIGRFKNERQILASLEHPNIARLLDGGTTEDGLPYFVMELIEGQPIDEFCNAHRLSISERLVLFRKVCAAVQYAHQCLIVHRDIKPGNILVTADGTPRLLDFGIAKILTEDSGINGARTATAFAALTPGYASPEQVLGNPITTASDVYSLGVVLYELLTGRPPYRILNRSPREIERAVCETEPERPSSAVIRIQTTGAPQAETGSPETAAVPEGSLQKLSKRLAGDLDNIVLMALRKEPARRYASVDQFSQDIQRHLEHLPIIARKATAIYRARKFVARYKSGVAAAALVGLTLIAGVVISLREARLARAERARAERRFNDVRNLSNTLLFQIDDSIKDLPGSTQAQQLLVSSAQQYLDSLSQEASGDVSLLHQLAEGYGRLGLIQGSHRGPTLGNWGSAIQSLRKAVSLREAIVRANPSDPHDQQALQESYEDLADPLLSVDLKEAAVYVDKSLKLAEALYSQDPSNTDRMHALSLAYQDQAQVLTRHNDLARATTVQARGLDLASRLAAAVPSASNQTLLSAAHKQMGGLLIAQKKYPQALSEYQAALSLDDSLLRTHPDNANARYAITFTYSDIGFIYWKERNYNAALTNYRIVLGLREALAKADPHDARAIVGVGRTCGYMADVLRDQNKPGEALNYDLRRLAILQRQPAGDHDLRVDVASTEWDIGDDYLSMAQAAGIKPERESRLQLAQRYLLQSSSAMADAKAHGLLYGAFVTAPQEIDQELAKCEALLRSSRAHQVAGSGSIHTP